MLRCIRNAVDRHTGTAEMRPTGEIRQALGAAAQALATERGGATWRDMAERAGVGYLAARRTVENMERSGALQPLGFEKREHSRRWMKLYVPGANFATSATSGACLLGGVVQAWPR